MSFGPQKISSQVPVSAKRSGDGPASILRERTFLVLQGALIAAATAYVYWPALHGGWLWDDDVEILGNDTLRHAAGLRTIWLSPKAADYFPLKTTLQWVQWHLWGSQVTGYHVTNVCLHLLSAFLLWRVLRKLGVRLAWLGGLIFAVHPLAVESVAWISELKNVLSLPFLLLAMGAWIDWDEFVGRKKAQNKATDSDQARDEGVRLPLVNSPGEFTSGSLTPSAASDGGAGTLRPTSEIDSGLRSLPRRSVAETGHTSSFCGKKRLLSLALFVLAMLCKSSVVMFPVILLLYCWWRRGRVTRSDLWATAPFFAVSLILGIVTVLFQYHRAIAGEAILTGGIASRFAVAGLAVAFYFWKAVFPIGLMPIYPRWNVDPPALWQFWPWVVIIGAGLGLLAKVGRRASVAPVGAESERRRRDASPHLIFGLGFFFINLLPVLGFVPMSILRLSWVADHLAYLPLLGLVGLAAAGIGNLFGVAQAFASAERCGHGSRLPSSKLQAGTPALPWALGLAVSVLLGALAFDSHRYAARFASAETLWTYNLRLNPDAWAAHNNLGNALFDDGLIAEAADQYREALRLHPDYPEADNNLGNIYSEAGQVAEAVSCYEGALRVKPDYAEAHNGLGNLLSQTGDIQGAIAQFELALKSSPNLAGAHNNLGNVFFQLGRYAEAEAQTKQALALQPDYPEAHNNLGNVYLRTGRAVDALAEYREALRLKPGFPQAYNNVGNIQMMSGHLQEAIASFDEAIRLRPGYAEAHFNLALVLSALGRRYEAIYNLKLALQSRPNFPQARARLEQLEKQ